MNKALINRYVKSLCGRKLLSSTINQKLSSIIKLATEAKDNNLIDSRLANGIRAVKGVPFQRKTHRQLADDQIRLQSDLGYKSPLDFGKQLAIKINQGAESFVS